MHNLPYKPRRRLARRELSALRSEKTILVAILIQLIVASFSSVLVVGVVTMYSPGDTGDGYTIEFGTVGPADDTLHDSIREREDTSLATYLSLQDAYDAYHKGEIDAIMYAERSRTGQLDVRLIAPDDGFTKSASVNKAREVLQTVEETERQTLKDRLTVHPLPVPEGSSSAPYAKFTYTVMLPILMFLPAFVSGSLVSDSVTEGLADGTMELLRVSSLSENAIFDAKVLTMVGLAPLQAVIWSGLLYLNGTPIANMPELMVIIIGISLIFGAIGAVTAYRFRNRSQAQLMYSIGSMTAFATLYLSPEHPVNSIAKLALDNPSPNTYPMIAFVFIIGLLAFVLARRTFTLAEVQ